MSLCVYRSPSPCISMCICINGANVSLFIFSSSACSYLNVYVIGGAMSLCVYKFQSPCI